MLNSKICFLADDGFGERKRYVFTISESEMDLIVLPTSAIHVIVGRKLVGRFRQTLEIQTVLTRAKYHELSTPPLPQQIAQWTGAMIALEKYELVQCQCGTIACGQFVLLNSYTYERILSKKYLILATKCRAKITPPHRIECSLPSYSLYR